MNRLNSFLINNKMFINSMKFTFISIVFPFFVYKVYKKLMNKTIEKKAFEHKVVVITGASSGLGKALAQVFYESGAQLILSSRRTAELEEVKNWLIRDCNTNDNSFEPKVLRLDLLELNDIELYAKQALSFYGRVDVIVNNGGISYRGSALSTGMDVDMRLMAVNYFGQLAVIKAFLPQMIERNSGRVVVIGSIQSQLALPYRSAYAASKHALQAFCDSLRAELFATNISVCVINPGYIKTNLSLNALTGSGGQYGQMDATTASGMEPIEVAKEVLNSILKNDKQLVLSPIVPKIAILVRVLFPNLYFYFMTKRAKKEKNINIL